MSFQMRGRDYERVEKVNGGQNGRSPVHCLFSPIFDSLPEYKRDYDDDDAMPGHVFSVNAKTSLDRPYPPAALFSLKTRDTQTILGMSALALWEVLFHG